MIDRIKGRQFESRVRSILRSLGFFVITKGVSTPGVDIIAFNKFCALVIELKFTSRNKIPVPKEQLENLIRVSEEIKSKTLYKETFPLLLVRFNTGYYSTTITHQFIESIKTKYFYVSEDMINIKKGNLKTFLSSFNLQKLQWKQE